MRGFFSAIRSALSAIFDAAEWLVFMPFRFFGNLLGGIAEGRQGKANAAGKQANQAADKAKQQVVETNAEADKVLALLQQASSLQRTAAFRARGHDFEKAFGDILAPEDLYYIKRLTIDECKTLAQTDARVVASFLSGELDRIPGVRSPEDLEADAVKARDAQWGPAPEPEIAPDEQAVLDRLSQRLQAMGRRPCTIDNSDLEYAGGKLARHRNSKKAG